MGYFEGTETAQETSWEESGEGIACILRGARWRVPGARGQRKECGQRMATKAQCSCLGHHTQCYGFPLESSRSKGAKIRKGRRLRIELNPEGQVNEGEQGAG